MTSKVIYKEIEIVDAKDISFKYGWKNEYTQDLARFTTKSGHTLTTKFFDPKDLELRGKHKVGLKHDDVYGWLVLLPSTLKY